MVGRRSRAGARQGRGSGPGCESATRDRRYAPRQRPDPSTRDGCEPLRDLPLGGGESYVLHVFGSVRLRWTTNCSWTAHWRRTTQPGERSFGATARTRVPRLDLHHRQHRLPLPRELGEGLLHRVHQWGASNATRQPLALAATAAAPSVHASGEMPPNYAAIGAKTSFSTVATVAFPTSCTFRHWTTPTTEPK